MNRPGSFLPLSAPLACWLFIPGRGEAQPAVIGRPPGYVGAPVSPYLNLLRQGSPAGVNYYDLVRPQFQFQNSIQALQQQVTTLGSQVAADEAQGASGMPVTGHPAQFFNYLHYFSARTAQGGTDPPPLTTPA